MVGSLPELSPILLDRVVWLSSGPEMVEPDNSLGFGGTTLLLGGLVSLKSSCCGSEEEYSKSLCWCSLNFFLAAISSAKFGTDELVVCTSPLSELPPVVRSPFLLGFWGGIFFGSFKGPSLPEGR